MTLIQICVQSNPYCGPKLLLGNKLSEFHTGYRAFSRKVLESLPLNEKCQMGLYLNEMLVQAIYFGYGIAEINCPTKYF